MPQIWPMNWLALFSFFIITLMVFLCLFYFISSVTGVSMQNSYNEEKELRVLYWKW